MSDDLNDWGRRLDEGRGGDPELELAARLSAARPRVPSLSPHIEAEMRARALFSARPSQLNARWSLATAASSLLVAALVMVLYPLLHPLPVVEPTTTPTPVPSPRPATPTVTVFPEFDQIEIVAASPGPGTLLPDAPFEFEVTVHYTLTTVSTAMLRVAFAQPDWDGTPKGNRLPLAGGVEVEVTAAEHSRTLRFPFTPEEELQWIAQDGAVALYVELSHITTSRRFFILDSEVSQVYSYPLAFRAAAADPMLTPGVTPLDASLATPPATATPIIRADQPWASATQLVRWGEGALLDIALSPDDDQLAVGTALGLELYDAQTLERLHRVDLDAALRHLAYSPDGQTLAASNANLIYLFDTRTGEIRRRLAGHTDLVTALAFSPDGKWLASGDENSAVWLWEAATDRPLFVLRGHTTIAPNPQVFPNVQGIASLAFSLDGKWLASGGWDKQIQIWQIGPGPEVQLARTITGHATGVSALAFNPQAGQQLASAGEWRFPDPVDPIRIWDVGTGQLVKEMQLSKSGVAHMAFSPDGRTLTAVSGSDRRTVQFWDASSGEYLRSVTGPAAGAAESSFSADGRELYMLGWDQAVRVWEMETGQETRALEQRLAPYQNFVLSPDGRTFASSDNNGVVYLWSLEGEPQLLRTFNDLAASHVFHLAFGPDGSELAAYGSEGAWWVWDTHTAEVQRSSRILRGSGLLLNPDDSAWYASYEALLWLPPSAIPGFERVEKLRPGVDALAYHPGTHLLAVGSGNQIQLIYAINGETLHTLARPSRATMPLTLLAFSYDGRWLISGARAGVVRVWDVSTGEQVRTLELEKITALATSPAGQLLATMGEDGVVRVWNISSGDLLGVLPGHTTWAGALAFTLDGRTLFSAGGDGTLRMWGAPSSDR